MQYRIDFIDENDFVVGTMSATKADFDIEGLPSFGGYEIDGIPYQHVDIGLNFDTVAKVAILKFFVKKATD